MEGIIKEVSLINKKGDVVAKFHPKQSFDFPNDLVDDFEKAIVVLEFAHKGILYQVKGKPIKT
jgi:hypothetical protein